MLDRAISDRDAAVERMSLIEQDLKEAHRKVAAKASELALVRRQAAEARSDLKNKVVSISKDRDVTQRALEASLKQMASLKADIAAMDKRLVSSSEMLSAHVAFLNEQFGTHSLPDAARAIESLRKQKATPSSPVVVRGSVHPYELESQFSLLFLQVAKAELRDGESFSVRLGHGTWKAYTAHEESLRYVGSVNVPKEREAKFPNGRVTKIDPKRRTLYLGIKGVDPDALLIPRTDQKKKE